MVKSIYFIKRMIRRQIPAPVFYWTMKLSRRTAKGEGKPDETFQAMSDRLNALKIDVAGKHVLDFGSGRYARLALRFLAAKAAHVSLADFYARPLSDPRHRAILEEDCARLGLDTGKARAAISLIPGDFLKASPDDPKMLADVIVSNSALEHVRDPLALLEKCREWLRPGGFVSHRVDLRDHLFDTPFEMLTCSEQTWNRWLNPKRGFHLNRWRLEDYLRAMETAGFTDIGYRALDKDPAALETIRPRLDGRFREMDPDLLAVKVVHLHARKPLC